MNETKRITKLFQDIYDGSPWIDVNLVNTLSNITATDAASRAMPGCNTVWEITNHIISWRKNVLRRLNGELIQSPGNNYFNPAEDKSEAAWQQTLSNLSASQQEWLDFLGKFNEDKFNQIYSGNRMTYYEHIHGIIQHDAYHLGQITLLLKFK